MADMSCCRTRAALVGLVLWVPSVLGACAERRSIAEYPTSHANVGVRSIFLPNGLVDSKIGQSGLDDAELHETLFSFLDSTYIGDGEFAWFQIHNPQWVLEAHLAHTYHALEIIRILNLDHEPPLGVGAWIDSLRTPDGSYRDPQDPDSRLYTTSEAILALDVLRQPPRLPNLTRSFIEAKSVGDCQFSDVPGLPDSDDALETTRVALAALRSLGAQESVETTGACIRVVNRGLVDSNRNSPHAITAMEHVVNVEREKLPPGALSYAREYLLYATESSDSDVRSVISASKVIRGLRGAMLPDEVHAVSEFSRGKPSNVLHLDSLLDSREAWFFRNIPRELHIEVALLVPTERTDTISRAKITRVLRRLRGYEGWSNMMRSVSEIDYQAQIAALRIADVVNFADYDRNKVADLFRLNVTSEELHKYPAGAKFACVGLGLLDLKPRSNEVDLWLTEVSEELLDEENSSLDSDIIASAMATLIRECGGTPNNKVRVMLEQYLDHLYGKIERGESNPSVGATTAVELELALYGSIRDPGDIEHIVREMQHSSGGFTSGEPGEVEPSMRSTRNAVWILSKLGRLEPADVIRVQDYVYNCRTEFGYTTSPTLGPPGSRPTADAFEILQLMGLTSSVP